MMSRLAVTIGHCGLVMMVALGYGGQQRCLGQDQTPLATRDSDEPQRLAHREIPSHEQAWRLLALEPTDSGMLPIWARALSPSLPATVGTMLQLDYLHRVDSPIDDQLRAKLRWSAARANHCEYSQATALVDLRATGLAAGEIEQFVSGQRSESAAEQRAIEFVRRLTVSGKSVTDEEVALLLEDYGEETTVAIVLLTAYANFLDRLILGLGIDGQPEQAVEAFAIFPALDIEELYMAPTRPELTERPTNEDVAPESEATLPSTPAWGESVAVDFVSQMEIQMTRPGRIKIPTFAEIAEQQGFDPSRRREQKVSWTLVCMGYQPQLTSAWFQCMSTFHRESQQDRIFEESLFWVITRTIDCFY